MNTNKLEGAALDYWALHADGRAEEIIGVSYAEFISYSEDDQFRFMFHWDIVGPIIDQERISVEADEYSDGWHAWCVHAALPDGVQRSSCSGPTPIIAALRCLVASKYGAEVPDSGMAA